MKPFHKEVKSGFEAMLNKQYERKCGQLVAPVIGLHIRRGDFKMGSTLTPLEFFISVVHFIRNARGTQLPVTIFSDAYDDELNDLLKLPDVKRATQQEDILDLLQLSRSAVLVMSIGSTFSLWAGFLSEGIIIRHKDEWHPYVIPQYKNSYQREYSYFGNEQLDVTLKQVLKGVIVK
jgi:hypothetical protein